MRQRSTIAATTSAVTLVSIGLAAGVVATSLLVAVLFSNNNRKKTRDENECDEKAQQEEIPRSVLLQHAHNQRLGLPSLILLVRHGESEGNADHTLYRTKPDNLVCLTAAGIQQAQQAGQRVEEILQCYEKSAQKMRLDRIHLVVSPFERTLQTAQAMKPYVQHRIVRTDIQLQIREQEFGNLQGDDFQAFRAQQKCVGRLWYRFPTGESGADVYDRVSSWWNESVLEVNQRVGYPPVDALVVVTHGLTMRFVLMQLYHWSPTTFHSVWNAENCDIYVLHKDLNKPGRSPYVLDDFNGDAPQSSIDLKVDFKNGTSKVYRLKDYLSIPPPRTTRLKRIQQRLAQQHGLDTNEIERISFLPFVDDKGATHPVQGSSSSSSSSSRGVGSMSVDAAGSNTKRPPDPEMSCRFPNFDWAVSQRGTLETIPSSSSDRDESEDGD
jgi:broad specificity phosphatase PhoE